MTTLTLIRPDDWHVHLRDGTLLAAVLPFTARPFARAVIMPNLTPPRRRRPMPIARASWPPCRPGSTSPR